MNSLWVIGSGKIAKEYIRILQDINHNFVCIGRGEISALECELETGCKVIRGGLKKFILDNKNNKCTHAIITTNPDNSLDLCFALLEIGVKKILIEKPGALRYSEFKKMYQKSKEFNAQVFIAYNRRFYASTQQVKNIIKKEKVLSLYFDFTEFSHIIEKINKNDLIKNKWFLANSTHVVDLAFFICGKPRTISSYIAGENSISWHKKSSIFCGSGVTSKDVLFAYHANWNSAGRWKIEILTENRKLIMQPLEKLFYQSKNDLHLCSDDDIDYSMDEKYKPGFYYQVKAFLNGNNEDLCGIDEQLENMDFYYKIASYDKD